MHQTVISTAEIERSAFALFSREALADDYKRTVCYLVYKTVNRNGMMQVSRLLHEMDLNYGVNREDVRSAISALKAPFAFNALDIFLPRSQSSQSDSKAKQVCRVVDSPEIKGWLAEIESKYPHVSRMVQ